jgi:hypothetical protein
MLESIIQARVGSYLGLVEVSKRPNLAAETLVLFIQVVAANMTTDARRGRAPGGRGGCRRCRLERAPFHRCPLDGEPYGPLAHRGRRGQGRLRRLLLLLAAPDLAVPERDGQVPDGVLHGPADGRPELGAGLAEPPADVDDRGDGGGGEGEVLPAGGAEGDDGEVDVEGHPLVRRGGRRPRELRRRLEQAREALREAVREVLAVPLHALPRLERDLHARHQSPPRSRPRARSVPINLPPPR